jgi:hypothetical protein
MRTELILGNPTGGGWKRVAARRKTMVLREHMGQPHEGLCSLPSRIPAEAEWITEQAGPTVTASSRDSECDACRPAVGMCRSPGSHTESPRVQGCPACGEAFTGYPLKAQKVYRSLSDSSPVMNLTVQSYR